VTSERGATDWISRATLSGVCCSLPVERNLLGEHLARLGPLQLEGADTREHVVLCELWTVREGRATPAGVDMAEALMGWAGAAARLSGMFWGAGLGWLSALAAGSTSELVHATRQGARTGLEGMNALLGSSTSEATKAISLPPYHELMLAVPDVRLAGDPVRYMAVLAMVTDSRVALAIDSSFGYGFAKQLGAFEVADPEAWTVSLDPSSRVRAHFAPAPTSAADAECVNRWWGQPLLGGFHAGSCISAWLERRIDVVAAQCSSLTATVAGLEHFVPGISRSAMGTALAFEGIASRISTPRRAG